MALDWPVERGGRDASLAERIIVQTELIAARAPRIIGHVGLDLVGPALIEHGSEAQKQRYLENIRTSEELWCQGFSEPNAGSDLGGLRTRAVLDGDHYVVSGQKVWTSVAEVADWCFLLARTDTEVKKHAGISALLVDMKQPGHHGAAAAPADRRGRVQRGLLRRRARAAARTSSASPATAGRSRWASSRTSAGRCGRSCSTAT